MNDRERDVAMDVAVDAVDAAYDCAERLENNIIGSVVKVFLEGFAMIVSAVSMGTQG